LTLGLENIERRVQALAALLRERLEQVRGVTVQDQGRIRCGIVTFTCEGHPATEVMQYLQANGIAVRITERSATRIDMEKLVRASVHYYNTEREIERFCEVVRKYTLH
jgi:cysteine desulfurase/selenocysteine lyase